MRLLNRLRRASPEAYLSFMKQINSGASYKKYGVILLFEISSLSILNKVPILGGLIQTVVALSKGHLTEAKTLNVKNDELRNLSRMKLLESNLIEPTYDVIIIGSGPGAAVAAQLEILAGATSILIAERGNTPLTPHSKHHSLSHVTNDFYQSGQELILAQGLPLYAQGNVLGGGSEVNSGLYHDLPKEKYTQYLEKLGISEDDWISAESQTRGILRPEEMSVAPNSSLLARGAGKCNLVVANVPRWRTYLTNSDFEHRGMIQTVWNQMSTNSNVSIATNLQADKIASIDETYLAVTFIDKLKQKRKITAKKVHVAAGAISTPSILARSGYIKWKDTRFQWHPMIRVIAETSATDLGFNDIDPFQAWTSDRSLKFGSAVSTPPLLAIALGKELDLEESRILRSFYVSYSSSGKGGLIPLLELPWYKFSKLDRELAALGLEKLKELIRLGGGKIVNEGSLTPKKQSTVHIFGTLPIGSDVYLTGSNALKREPRIRVSDASLLPSGPGVNPQGVIMTVVRILNGKQV